MNTQRIPSIEPSAATGSNKKYFDMFQGALGVIPNMTRAMAQSPAVLEGYVALNVFTNYFNNVAETEIDFPKITVA